jgi:predicted RNase H-like HicB family nuclease
MAVQESERRRPRTVSAEQPYQPSPVPRPVITFFAILRQIFGKAEIKRETTYDPPTVEHAGTWKLCVSVEADELDGGYVAECLDVPGAMAQGDTEQEALQNLIDAVQAVVAAKMEESFEATSFDPAFSAAKRKIGVTF